MLIFGPYQACLSASTINRDCVFFNFTSLVQSIPRLGFLLPSLDVVNTDPITLSTQYSSCLLTNVNAFTELMAIMMPLYEGKHVFVCTSGETLNSYLTIMNEMLPEFIKIRYGYQSVFINNADDLNYFDEGDYGFSVQGIQNFDHDRDWLIMSKENERLNNGGRPYQEG